MEHDKQNPESSYSIPAGIEKINKFVVLMFENRSFDHIFGYRKLLDPKIDGVRDGEFFNYSDPNISASAKFGIRKAEAFAMPFDPGHEFLDVQIQLYGPKAGTTRAPNPDVDPVPMSGFVGSAAAASATEAGRVLECFRPDQIPVLSALAEEFAVANYWHASLPGPTWPNRFFVHAATSGGVTYSPDKGQILRGFAFETIYDRLKHQGKGWRIYHDGLPQAAGIDSLRLEYIDLLTKDFREMRYFAKDAAEGKLPEYTFIEPAYDTGHGFVQGNSMHPRNDLRRGEWLLKSVYESLRNSPLWKETLLIVTFDEHGGFYDHVPPPKIVPTGDDTRYAMEGEDFSFARLGVRVPALLISPYTQKGAVIDCDENGKKWIFDHTSILATVEKKYGLPALTARDQNAMDLNAVLDLVSPRLLPREARMTLPRPFREPLWKRAAALVGNVFKPVKKQPLGKSQAAHLALALACDLGISEKSEWPSLHARHDAISTHRDAAKYLKEVENKIHARRRENP